MRGEAYAKCIAKWLAHDPLDYETRFQAGRRKGGGYYRMYSRGCVLYSYGEHFALAKIARPHGGKWILVLNSARWSDRAGVTSRQQRELRWQAERQTTYPVAEIPEAWWGDEEPAMRDRVRVLNEDLLGYAFRARLPRMKEMHVERAAENVARVDRYWQLVNP